MVALAALFSLPSAAQTVTITSPICGATWTDWWGKLVRSFFVVAAKCRASLLHGGCVWRRKSWAGADEQRRLLQSPALQPGSEFLPMGKRSPSGGDVYDALGNQIATSSIVAFTIGNAWPCAWVPALSVTPATPFTSNWSMHVNLSLTLTGTGVGTDTFNYQTYVDGTQQAGAIRGSGSFSVTLDTTQFPDGTQVIAATVTDNTGWQAGGRVFPSPSSLVT
jgi:hypothetical protein